MKIKAGEIRLINEGLQEILQKELPTKPSYWLARFATKLGQEFEPFEKARINLLNQYVNKDEKGKLLFKKDNKGKDVEPKEYDFIDREAFDKEFIVLAEQEFEIDFKPIKLADLGDIKLKPLTLARLDKLIEE